MPIQPLSRWSNALGFGWNPLIYPYIEIICTSRPKILLHNQILPMWEEDPRDLEILFSIKEIPPVSRDSGQLSATIKTTNSNLLEVREFSLTLALLSFWRFFYHWLNNWRVFGRHYAGALCLVLLFCSFGTPIGACVDDQLTDDFYASSYIMGNHYIF